MESGLLVKDYFGLLLLIIPGFLCNSIFTALNEGGVIRKNDSGLRVVLKSLLFSVGVWILNYIFLCIGYQKFWLIAEIAGRFGQIPFILLYTGITLIDCLLLALLLDSLQPAGARLLNFFRRLSGKPALASKETVWDEIVANQENHAVVIERNNKELFRGVVDVMSFAGDGEMELYIKSASGIPQEIDPEAIKGVYLDLKHGLLIKILDPLKLVKKP
ncbi:MAG: DUF6338 family protein [Firmicutes bacterium]|nr:DUF6338 family protein [Bacillota bacterium]